MDWGPVIGATIPSVAVVLAAWVTSRGQHRIHDKLKSVAEEVTTINGNTLANLADAGEGRRSQAIPKARRTDKEQHAVDRYLEERRGETIGA